MIVRMAKDIIENLGLFSFSSFLLYLECDSFHYCSRGWFKKLDHWTITFIKSSPTDDLVDWNSGVSVRLYTSVRTYVHEKFFQYPSNLVCG